MDASTQGTATRYTIALFGGVLVSWLLLSGMQWMLNNANTRLRSSDQRPLLDFVRVKRDETVRAREAKPPRPRAPQPTPGMPTAPRFNAARPSATPMAVAPVAVAADIELSAEGFSLDVGGGDYLPIVKVPPIYPRRALLRGVQGFVILEFTVTELGTVTDVRVLESDPPTRVFHEAAIDAARQFKYTPRSVDGSPVATPGVRHKFTFRIEDDA